MGDHEIKSAIQKLSGVKKNQVDLISAEVVSVDEAKRTCIVTTTGGEETVQIENVQLMASVDDGFLLIPALGSTILISHSTYNKPHISLFSELEKVLLVVGDKSVEITKDGIVFNDGTLGGLVKVETLVDRLNTIEQKVNTIINWGGLVTPALATTPLSITQRSQLENKNVTHG